jgi:hypothetical protein
MTSPSSSRLGGVVSKGVMSSWDRPTGLPLADGNLIVVNCVGEGEQEKRRVGGEAHDGSATSHGERPWVSQSIISGLLTIFIFISVLGGGGS